MPKYSEKEVGNAWLEFVDALEYLLDSLPKYRSMDQYISIKKRALVLARGERAVSAIFSGYEKSLEYNNKDNPDDVEYEPLALVVEEFLAFSNAVNVNKKLEAKGKSKKGIVKKLLSVGKTTLGSAKDLFELSTFGKGVLTVLKEAIEFFE